MAAAQSALFGGQNFMHCKALALALSLCASFASTQTPPPQAASPSTSVTPLDTNPAFEVATIKRVPSDAQKGRFIVMQGTNRFVEKDYTLKLLIAAAYDLTPRAIFGGPAWIDSDHFDITALTPGDTRPTRDQQMAMLRNLLADRFQLTFHREPKEFNVYALQVDKAGPKLRSSAAPPDTPAALVSTVYPQRILLPARNTTMHEFVSLLQRAVLDRAVIDRTGLTGKYDFDLEWAPDETQFGGDVPVASADAPSPPFFRAIQQQLGLTLVATRGPIDTLIIDLAARPTAD
jgi:uncharacterized protein (TIGR03435 family)